MSAQQEALVFSSRLTGRDDAVDGLRDLYAAGARCEPFTDDVFASVRARRRCGVVVFERRVNGLALVRDASQVRRTGFDHFVLQLVTGGELRLTEGDARRRLRAGDAALLDTTRPFSTEASQCRLLTLSLSRERLVETGLDISRLHEATASARFAAEARDVLTTLLDEPDRGDTDALLSRLLRPLEPAPHGEASTRTGRLRRRERALAYIEANLHRRDLTPEVVVEGTHTSRATLYRAFEELGGVSDWILSRRLRRLRTALATDGRPLAPLTHELGFTSPSHASKAFQARYDVRPGALRTARRADSSGSGRPADATRRLLADMPAAHVREARILSKAAA